MHVSVCVFFTGITDPPNLWYLIAACGGALLIIILLIVVLCCCCRKKKKDHKEEVKNVAKEFDGFWKRKTVRGSVLWMEEEGKAG